MTTPNAIADYGWTPLDHAPILHDTSALKPPHPILVKDIHLPTTPLTNAITAFVKHELPPHTFNHSLRVYHYGQAIRTLHFPHWSFTDETWLLTCLLHDIGTTPAMQRATLLSFEFFGGMLAYKLIHEVNHAPREQAEGVAEAIIRHQDLGSTGKITTVGELIQLATLFDNMGKNPGLIHEDTIRDVVKHYPRLKWSGCFSETLREENRLKPWANNTALGVEEYPDGVRDNKLMEPYE